MPQSFKKILSPNFLSAFFIALVLFFTTSGVAWAAPSSSSGCHVNGVANDIENVSTVIGCLPTEPSLLINRILTYVLGFAGGVALLLMIFGAIGMITSAGNSEALNSSRSRFNSAFIGLIFIIFSVLLLQIIGHDILNIPGFGT